ncbi:transposase [Candidatus Bathyarchaeota archaeon]|nr:transposase [Candidatus Bathyarchaeota archaeon]
MEVVKAVVFKHNADVKPLLDTFNQMVNECMTYASKNNISSPMKLERSLYDHFKQKYGFATHYCISACRVACGIIRSWKRLVKKGRTDHNKPPTFKASAIRLQKELMRFKGDKIVVTVKPYSWIEIPLIIGSYQKRFIEEWKKGELKIGEITLLNNRAVVAFKREVEEKEPNGYASVDINLMSLDILETKNELKYRKIDLKKLYGIRVHYFEKRRKIQALSKYKPETSRRLMEKYSERERRRVNDILHKITTAIVREFVENGVSPILEKLKGLSYNATRNKHAKRKNRKVSSLPYRKIQSFIEYKMAWYGYKTYYIPAKGTSKTCPRCGRSSKTNGQVYECRYCGYRADRHFVAGINILGMWGVGFIPKVLNELIEREGLSRGDKIL